MRDLKEIVCIITGAASGIGKACAEALAGAGCSLVLVDLQESALQELAGTLSETAASTEILTVAVSSNVIRGLSQNGQSMGLSHITAYIL